MGHYLAHTDIKTAQQRSHQGLILHAEKSFVLIELLTHLIDNMFKALLLITGM
jgi:hypothetical protein